MGLAIVGMGTACPPGCFTQEEMTDVARVLACETEDHVEAARSVHQHTEIRTRHLSFSHSGAMRMLQ